MSLGNLLKNMTDWMAQHNPLESVFGEFSIIRPESLVNLAYASMILLIVVGLIALHKRNFVGVPMLVGFVGACAAVYGFAAGEEWTQTALVTGKVTHDTPITVTVAFVACIIGFLLTLVATGWLATRHANPLRKWLQIVHSLVALVALGLFSNGLAGYYDSLFQVSNKLNPLLWLVLLVVLCAALVLELRYTIKRQRRAANHYTRLGKFLPRRGNRTGRTATPSSTLFNFTEKVTRTDLAAATQAPPAEQGMSSMELSETSRPTDAIQAQPNSR